MKNYVIKVIAILTILTITSCEKVIDVGLETAAQKIVIDAAIQWKKGTTGNEQKIKLTTTAPYFNTTVPVFSGAIVTITNNTNNTIFTFTETPNTGNYLCTNFVPIIGNSYTLKVWANNQFYTATDTLLATPTITDVEQKTVNGFEGDEIQIKYFYRDNGLENNYYLLTVKQNNLIVPEFGVTDDKFFQGNQMFGFYTEENLKPTDILDLSVQGISESYFNYMSKLISISNSGGNPFSTPPATLRGNLKNETIPKNFPLGYFSLGEVDTKNYTVQN